MLSTTLGLFLRKDTRRPRLILALVAAVILSTLAGAIPAAAQNRSLPLYTITAHIPELLTIDPLTGEVLTTTVLVDAAAAVAINGGLGLAVSPDGDLYGNVWVNAFDHLELGLIDPASGEVTLIGQVDLDGTLLDRIPDLTFDADGILYGVTGRDFTPENRLIIIDPATALATEVLDLTVGAFDNRGNGIAFNPEDGLIYHTTFHNTNGAPFMQTIDPAAADVAASVTEVTLSVDVFSRPNSMEFFGNGFFLVQDSNQEIFLVKSTGEVRFLSTDQSANFNIHALAFAGTPPAARQALYGAANVGADGPSLFYAIDAASGAATLIGPTGFERMSAIAFDFTVTATGAPAPVLWGQAQRMDGTDQTVMVTIDPLTGLGTEVAETDLETVAVPTGGGPGVATDMSFNSLDELFAFVEGDDELATVDLTTDPVAFTLLGTTVSSAGGSLAFDPADDTFVYHTDCGDLNTLDTTDGSVILAVALAGNTGCINAMVFNPSTGLLIGSDSVGSGGGARDLVTIDTTTAAVAAIGATQDGLDALALDVNVTDVAITKTGASADPATIEVTYTITVTNNGPIEATGVVVRDRFPTPDLFIVTSITPSQGNCDETGSTRFCRLGDLAVGAVATIDVSGFSFSAGTRNNRVNISALVQTDSNPANSSFSFPLAMRSFSIAVTPSRTIVAAGSTGVYEVTVTPDGGPITGVVALACANISGAVTLSCSFNPATVGFGATGDVPGTSTLTVTPGAATAHLVPSPSSQPSAPLFAVWLGLPVLAFIGLRAFGGTRRRTAVALAMLTLLVLSLLPLAGCNNNDQVVAPPLISTFRVQGSIGNATIPAPSFTSIEVQQ